MRRAVVIAERVESRLRAEWPGTTIPKRMAYIPETITPDGATDTLIKLVARIVREEIEKVNAGV